MAASPSRSSRRLETLDGQGRLQLRGIKHLQIGDLLEHQLIAIV
jgi:hypothetical protein